jgi:hypothetical protein
MKYYIGINENGEVLPVVAKTKKHLSKKINWESYKDKGCANRRMRQLKQQGWEIKPVAKMN